MTERLKVMSYVYVLPMRDPLLVAKQVGTLAALVPRTGSASGSAPDG